MKMQIRKHLEKIPPYTPIEPFEVLSARIERSVDQIIKLDANENPYGPLPVVRETLANLPYAHIYPDPESRLLRQKLSQFCQIPMDNLLIGAGADELIDLLLRVFIDEGDSIVIFPPTFGMYAFDARLNNAQVWEIPRQSDFSINLEVLRRVVREKQPKIIFLATPNNPDGSFPNAKVIEQILELPALVVLDEAYIEFADQPQALGSNLSRIRQVPLRDNLVVLRTFSKLAALAGLRIGYGAFPTWLMPTLWKAKQPYSVNVAASAAAMACLDYPDELAKMVEWLVQERQRLYTELQNFSFLSAYPSLANYILVRVTRMNAAQLKERLAYQFGIFVRYFNSKGLQDHIRISVGKPSDTDALLGALQTIEKEEQK